MNYYIIFGVAAIFMLLERVVPGRPLPNSTGWYIRSLFLNGCQLLITLSIGTLYWRIFPNLSLFDLSHIDPWLQGFFTWFVGTFIFYWWHRFRHEKRSLWILFHQIHHSATRIEVLTAFYKHPIEIFVNAILSSIILYLLLGCSLEAALWYNIFAAGGEMFYHSNIATPQWLGWFIQRPEHHSIHHQYKVHHHNYGDITWWDRMFGTFKDAERGEFVSKCGFTEAKERQLLKMLFFKNNY